MREQKTDVGRGIEIVYQRLGDEQAPPVFLIMGVGAQLVHWPDELCRALVDRGLQVVRFDNRDAGRSTHLHDAPPPDLAAAMAGDPSSASYTLSDMAADVVGLMGALGLASAHLVGASMGGAIAQTVAIEHPDRVRSLTSIMFTTGDPAVGQPHPAALSALFGGPPPQTRDEAVERAVVSFRAVGSPGFPMDEAAVRERAGLAYDRAWDPVGAARQGLATIASGDRTARLAGIRVPTLVIHGLADRMVDVSGGRATAAAIPGAELVLIEGLGHDLPRELWPRLAELVAGIVARGEQQSAG